MWVGGWAERGQCRGEMYCGGGSEGEERRWLSRPSLQPWMPPSANPHTSSAAPHPCPAFQPPTSSHLLILRSLVDALDGTLPLLAVGLEPFEHAALVGVPARRRGGAWVYVCVGWVGGEEEDRQSACRRVGERRHS